MKLLLLALLLVYTISLPYQAHGFNDLQYFIQLLKKGIRTFKMDLSLLSKKSCMEQSSWKQGDNVCFTLPAYAQELCCLGFRGDTSSTPEVRYQFNTSKEFVDVLAHPDLQIILRQKIFLAINFQYVDSQNEITKNFLYDVLSAIKLRNLSITIATGTDNVILDYDYKCVIQGKCDQKEKFISDSNIVLQSSSQNPFHPHDVKKRYRNFNVFYQQVSHFCEKGFPSWVDKYDYPLIFWQPSSEQQIQFVLNKFLSSSCKRPANHNTIQKIALASNLQPEVFQVFALGKGVDYGVGEKLQIQNAANPFLTILETNGVKNILIGYNDVGSKNWKIDLLNSKNPKQKINSITFADASIRNLKGSEDTFLACLEYNNGTKIFRIYNSSLQQLGQFGASQFYALTYYKQIVYYVTVSSSEIYNRVSLDVVKGSFVISGCSINFVPTDATYLDTLYFVGSKDGITYLNKNCSDSNLKISYSKNAKITSGDNQLYIFQSEGMCQSAVLMNNNQMNKCDFFNDPDFQSLKNVPHMITYIAGTVENIMNELNKTNWVPISGCSQNVYSAKIGNGDKVSPIALNGRLHFAHEYVPISKQPFITTVFCGGSNFDNRNTSTVVISSFDTPPLTKNKRETVLLEE